MPTVDEMENLRSLLEQHHESWRNAIPLIASENITSWFVREATISDLCHRYAEGWVGERVYAGCQIIDKVESLALDLMTELYDAPFADLRPVSGVVANLAVYSAFARAGDLMLAISIASGGHISHAPEFASSGVRIGGTAGSVTRLDVKYLPFDPEVMNIDVDKAEKVIRELEPKIINFGASVFLFPHPVKELADAAKEVGAHVNYDAAHVAGLIAGGQFQDPLREGADTVTMSTHKTLFGPQKGAILAASDELASSIKQAAFPGVTSNHHLHNIAGLAAALIEFKHFGRDYAKQVINNAKRLASSLYERGFNVVCPDLGFTNSHTVLIDISNFQSSIGLGKDIEELLERANIIINRNLLPWDIKQGRNYKNPGGIRLGTSEITRLGMKESEMDYIAELFKKLLIDRKDAKEIREEVQEFRQNFQALHYAFPSDRNPYDYLRIG